MHGPPPLRPSRHTYVCADIHCAFVPHTVPAGGPAANWRWAQRWTGSSACSTASQGGRLLLLLLPPPPLPPLPPPPLLLLLPPPPLLPLPPLLMLLLLLLPLLLMLLLRRLRRLGFLPLPPSTRSQRWCCLILRWRQLPGPALPLCCNRAAAAAFVPCVCLSTRSEQREEEFALAFMYCDYRPPRSEAQYKVSAKLPTAKQMVEAVAHWSRGAPLVAPTPTARVRPVPFTPRHLLRIPPLPALPDARGEAETRRQSVHAQVRELWRQRRGEKAASRRRGAAATRGALLLLQATPLSLCPASHLRLHPLLPPGLRLTPMPCSLCGCPAAAAKRRGCALPPSNPCPPLHRRSSCAQLGAERVGHPAAAARRRRRAPLAAARAGAPMGGGKPPEWVKQQRRQPQRLLRTPPLCNSSVSGCRASTRVAGRGAAAHGMRNGGASLAAEGVPTCTAGKGKFGSNCTGCEAQCCSCIRQGSVMKSVGRGNVCPARAPPAARRGARRSRSGARHRPAQARSRARVCAAVGRCRCSSAKHCCMRATTSCRKAWHGSGTRRGGGTQVGPFGKVKCRHTAEMLGCKAAGSMVAVPPMQRTCGHSSGACGSRQPTRCTRGSCVSSDTSTRPKLQAETRGGRQACMMANCAHVTVLKLRLLPRQLCRLPVA